MTKSKRLDRYAAFFLHNDDIIVISDEQFEALQSAGRCDLNKRNRSELHKALERFIILKNNDKMASTRSEQYTVLNNIKNHTEALYDIFMKADTREEGSVNLPDWHKSYRALNRIEDALTFKQTDDEDARWEERKNFILCRNKKSSVFKTQELLDNHQTEPLVDLENFKETLNWLHLGVNQAIENFKAEGSNDTGAKEADKSLDGLLLNLEQIYNNTSKQGRGLMNFIYEALQLIPEDTPRPNYGSSQTETLRDRLKLAKTR